MNSDGTLTIIVLIVLLIIVLRSKPFKVWWMGRNKTDDQKKAIKFLIYGPSTSRISKAEYDKICNGMYPGETIFEKAKSKLGISDSDIVKHPCKDIDSPYLWVKNYLKEGDKVLVFDLGNNEFRSSRMDCLIVIFGRKKLYFYQLSYRTDKTEETEETYSYAYEKIRQFKVAQESTKNDYVSASIALQLVASDKEAKDEQKEISYWQNFPSMVMGKESFDRWKAVGDHLDSPELKKEYKDMTSDEKNALRYFKAHYNLPLSISDKEYEAMIVKILPSEELKEAGMNSMGIEDTDIRLADPIAFRSFVYDQGVLAIKGRDETWRSNKPKHTWLFFGKHQI